VWPEEFFREISYHSPSVPYHPSDMEHYFSAAGTSGFRVDDSHHVLIFLHAYSYKRNKLFVTINIKIEWYRERKSSNLEFKILNDSLYEESIFIYVYSI
jgi:hypothetical protein